MWMREEECMSLCVLGWRPVRESVCELVNVLG